MTLIPKEHTHAHNKEFAPKKGEKKGIDFPTPPPRIPYVGEIVLFTSNPGDTIAKSNFNHDEIAAIVTRVWSHGCVNLKIIPDCGAMQDRTSVVHQSINPAGYHFRFKEEEHEQTNPNDIILHSGEAKDASSFLDQK